MLIRSLASICLYLELCLAAKVSVLVQSSPILNNPSNLPPSTHAILLGPPGTRYDVPLRRDNTFVFPDLTEASYLLTIHTLHYNFQPLRVDVSNTGSSQKIEAWQTFRGNEWSNKGPSVGSSSGGNDLQIQVRPSGQREYYSQRGGFNLVAFLKSPMILMGLVSVVMIFGFPYLMDNMDEETKKDLKEIQSKGTVMGDNGAANQIQNFDLAGWMAGKTSSSSGASPDGGGGSSKKR